MTTNFIKTSLFAFFFGFRDSLLGAVTLLSIDKDTDDSRTSHGEKYNENERPPGRRGPRPRQGKEESKVIPMMMQCCFLNGGIFLLSMVIFENYLIPLTKFIAEKIFVLLTGKRESPVWLWIEPIMSYTFGSLWVIPLFWLSKILNSLWFLEIADVAYRRKHGRPLTSILATRTDSIFKYLSKLMSDFLFSIVLESLFLCQANMISLIPVIGPPFTFLHLSLLYSLYAFEYTWMNFGWGVVKRISYIENHWPYFLGFGFLLSFLSTMSSTVVSGCLFGVLFPLFILSGLEARPSEERDYPIRVFSMAIWLTNTLFLRSKTRKNISTNASSKFSRKEESQAS